ncbi:MAG: ABC transporter ATP-binding protein, partial [Flavitalea sp.]
MMFPLLQIKDLQVDFVNDSGAVTAVKAVNFTIQRGEIVGIAGESGSGKSVTAMAILQLLASPPAKYVKGEILFSPDGHHQYNMIGLTGKQLRSIRGKQIGMIFQEPMTSLNPVFTCGYQVMEAIRLHENIPEKEARKKTLALFEKVKLPDPALIFNRYPHQVSGGQKQRVMIAMAVSGNPSLLICDEPTTALDVTVQKSVMELIGELQSGAGMGVIFITHDLGLIAEIASRAIIMYKGSIVEEGAVSSMFSAPAHPYTKALLACRPSLYAKGTRLPSVSDFLLPGGTQPGSAQTAFINTQHDAFLKSNPGKTDLPSEETDPLSIVSEESLLKSGDESSSVTHLSKSSVEPFTSVPVPLLTVNRLEVWFPGRKSLLGKPLSFIKAVNDISFEVYAGETLGLVGESGSGKTTLGRALLQLIPPTSGNILYEGTDLSLLNPACLRKFRKNLQIIFQDPYSSLNPSMTVGAAIEEPLKVHGLQPQARKRKEKVIELLEKVNLDADHYYRYPHEFSGGQRQRIVIARAIALEPSFIICDESVSALDVSIQAQILNLLNDLKKEFGFTN